jgi:hypothetical protein
MGGKGKFRDDFLHWFAGVEDFEYELALQRVHKDMDIATEAAEHDEEGNRNTHLQTAEVLGKSKRELEMSFKVIGTVHESSRENALVNLKQQLQDASRVMESFEGEGTRVQ